MKVKLGELEEILLTVPSVQKKLPTKAAYWIARFLKVVQKEYEVLQDRRLEIVEKHAQRNDNGPITEEIIVEGVKRNQYVLGSNQPKFEKEWRELLKEEVEIDFRLMPIDQVIPKGMDECLISDLTPIIRFIIDDGKWGSEDANTKDPKSSE